MDFRDHAVGYVLSTAIVLIGLVPGLTGTSMAFDSSVASFDPRPTTDVIIDVKTRQFQPDTISLPLGQKTRFILRNKDAELHAFVPVGLFLNTTLNVTGNGAPQFGEDGLLRVLLPSTGQTEILFTPERPGNYPFFCDLPGHIMRGTIVVQD